MLERSVSREVIMASQNAGYPSVYLDARSGGRVIDERWDVFAWRSVRRFAINAARVEHRSESRAFAQEPRAEKSGYS